MLIKKANYKKININNLIHANTIVYVDENMKSSIFRNVFSNTIKFTDRQGQITISNKENGDFEIISVQDTSVGIDSEDISKLFSLDH